MSLATERQPELSLYANQTDRVSRPSRTTHPQLRDDELAHQQRSWDLAKQYADQEERIRAEQVMTRDAARAAEQERSRVRQEAAAEQATERRAEELKRIFLLHGTDADWERQKGGILGEDRTQRTLIADAQARSRNARRYG